MTPNDRPLLRLIIVDDETLARQRLRFLLDDIQTTHPTEVIGEAADGETALSLCQQLIPDVLILDIRMPAKDGLDVARALLAQNGATKHPAFLFTTAYRNHACEAFDVDALDYLIKPVRIERLMHALDKAYSRYVPSTTPALFRLAFPGRQQTQWIDLDRLLYFKAEHKYTTIITRDGEYLTDISLTELENRYGEHLIRIHRNCLIVRMQLTELRHTTAGWHVRLNHCTDLLEVSRRQLPLLRTAMQTTPAYIETED